LRAQEFDDRVWGFHLCSQASPRNGRRRASSRKASTPNRRWCSTAATPRRLHSPTVFAIVSAVRRRSGPRKDRKPRALRSPRSGRRPTRRALTISPSAEPRSALTLFRSTTRQMECRASTDPCGSHPTEAVSKQSGWGGSRADNSCQRLDNWCSSEPLTPRRSNPAQSWKLLQTGSCGVSRSSTPAYSSTRFRGWIRPAHVLCRLVSLDALRPGP